MSAGVFFEVRGVPVHVGALWPSAEAARACARGDIRLALDPGSGLIRNVAFEPERVDYRVRYDNALHFSPTFRAFEDALARRLIDRYGLRGKEIVEIGAGGGRFLGVLCELGDNRGTGYDPSHDPEAADARVGGRVRVVPDYYSERSAARPADFVCCRHVLEHVPDPAALLQSVRQALKGRPETVVYFEVPNTYPILRELAVWDVIYEHCSYFVPESLAALFGACGFEVLDVYESYEGQFTAVEARVGGGGPTRWDSAPLAALAGAFGRRFEARRESWQRRLETLHAEGRRAVVWGGGAKAVSFLNLLAAGDGIEWVVDVNPGKQGSFLAGTGQPIVAPSMLREVKPDVVIVMNPLYREEIEAELRGLCPAAAVVCVQEDEA